MEKYRTFLNTKPALREVCEKLAALSTIPSRFEDDKKESPLALSTLRGQFADNRQWCSDPSRPAVVVGTVDMIGSRLLFGGYGMGFKGKPLHAGFLGQDVLLVHDEAHLEPAFQKLLNAIEQGQERCNEFEKFRVMELSATSRGAREVFGLTDEDRANSDVMKRIFAKKAISLYELDDEKNLADRIAKLSQADHMKDRAVLLDQARLKPHELLHVTTFGKGRAYDQLQKIAERTPDLPVWIIEPDGSLLTDKTISDRMNSVRGSMSAVPLNWPKNSRTWQTNNETSFCISLPLTTVAPDRTFLRLRLTTSTAPPPWWNR